MSSRSGSTIGKLSNLVRNERGGVVDALEPLDPYYTRFRKRFLADAAPWARDNILWGVVVLVVPPIAAFLHNPHTPIDWTLLKNSLVLYTFALAAYSLAYLSLTAERLDADRQAREQLLNIAVAEREQTIREREDSIHVLTEKPKRSSAEQHDYDKAMKALELLKDKGLIAMRHIRSQGS